MRIRFLILSSVIFILSHVLVLLATSEAWQKIYWQVVDRELETIAAIIQEIPFHQKSFDEIESYHNRINQELGSQPLNIFFRIYDERKNLILSESSIQLPEIFELSETISKKEAFLGSFRVRYLVVPLTKKRPAQRYLVVGFWKTNDDFEKKIFIIWLPLVIILVFVLTGVLVFGLIRFLLKPIDQLIRVINDSIPFLISPNTEVYLKDLDTIAKYSEFKPLVSALENWFRIVRERLRKIESVNSQLMHEMKTPLTILSQAVENDESFFNPEARQSIRSQVNNLKEVVTSFLDWLQAQYQLPLVTQRHVMQMSELLKEVALSIGSQNNVQWEVKKDFRFFGPLFYFKRFWSNILSNAFNYSFDISRWPVEIEIDSPIVRITNVGYPFPPIVKERLGWAFNFVEGYPHGHGLGLALVYLIAQHFKLQLEIWSQEDPSKKAHRVTIQVDFSPILIHDQDEI